MQVYGRKVFLYGRRRISLVYVHLYLTKKVLIIINEIREREREKKQKENKRIEIKFKHYEAEIRTIGEYIKILRGSWSIFKEDVHLMNVVGEDILPCWTFFVEGTMREWRSLRWVGKT